MKRSQITPTIYKSTTHVIRHDCLTHYLKASALFEIQNHKKKCQIILILADIKILYYVGKGKENLFTRFLVNFILLVNLSFT